MNSVFIVVGGAATGYILTLVLTHLLHISGPLAMVVAGLIIGNKIHIDVTCNNIQKTVADFWLMIDEIMNAIVFFMMGLILHLLEFDWHRVLLIGFRGEFRNWKAHRESVVFTVPFTDTGGTIKE